MQEATVVRNAAVFRDAARNCSFAAVSRLQLSGSSSWRSGRASSADTTLLQRSQADVGFGVADVNACANRRAKRRPNCRTPNASRPTKFFSEILAPQSIRFAGTGQAAW